MFIGQLAGSRRMMELGEIISTDFQIEQCFCKALTAIGRKGLRTQIRRAEPAEQGFDKRDVANIFHCPGYELTEVPSPTPSLAAMAWGMISKASMACIAAPP